jgi:hypothetical protein
MEFKVSSFGCCCVLALWGAGGLVQSTALAQGETRHTRAIELSETNNTEVLKRLNQLGDKKDEYKELGDEWSKSFGAVSAESPESGALTPYYARPGARAIPTKRVKDLLERQKNWTLTPTDLISANGSQDWSQSSGLQTDGQEKTKSSSVTQFYNAMSENSRAGSNNGGQDDERAGGRKQSMFRDELNTVEDPTLPAGVRDEAQQLRKLLTDQASTGASGNVPTETRSTVSDFFGFGAGTPTRAETAAQQTRMKDLQALYGIASSPTPSSSDLRMNALAPAASAGSPIGPGGLPAATALRPDSTLSTLGARPSIWSPGAASTLDTPFHQWNPMYTPQTPELPKATSPQPIAPAVEFPHRKF